MGAVIERDEQPMQVAQQPGAEAGTVALMRMIERAVLDPNFDVTKLEKMIEVKERWDREEARKAYAAAMAEFKRNPPQIVKDAHVCYRNKGGGTTEYDHETIGLVCAAVIPALAKVGFSHSWKLLQEPKKITVTCVLTHERGHSENVSLYADADESGGKNDIQAIGSTVKYFERYTLLAACGLAPLDREDDGRDRSRKRQGAAGAGSGGEDTGPKYISETQVTDLKAKMEEVGANKDAFLKVLKVSKLEEVQTNQYAGAIQRLNDKARGVR